MTVTVYKSTDSSAPVLTGVAGTLVALLDAILVNGYGAKASQGWTKSYSASNAASYRTASGNQRYLRVVSDGTTSARVIGYEVMTSQTAGTGPFPTNTQVSGGLYIVKSATADSTARPWFAYGNGKIFYLFIATDSGASYPVMGTLFFGDYVDYSASSAYGSIIIANTDGYGTVTSSANWALTVNGYVSVGNILGHFMPRSYTGLGTSIGAGKLSNGSLGGFASVGSTPWQMGSAGSAYGTTGSALLVYPNAPDSGLYLEKMWVTESSVIRGELPGLWCPMHALPLTHLDTFSGSGALAGKTFEVLSYLGASYNGQVFMETSNTW